MEVRNEKNLVTVQGVMTPVPAAFGGARAGHQSSRSNACNVTPVSLDRVTDNATSNKRNKQSERSEQNPFSKCSKLARSPPTGIKGPINSPFEGSSKLTRSPVRTLVQMASSMERTEPSKSQVEIDAGSTVEGVQRGQDRRFEKLGVAVSKLVDFFKGRNNIHKEIIAMAKEIQVLYMQISHEPCKAIATADKETNTDAILSSQIEAGDTVLTQGTPLRKRLADVLSPKENRKKRKKRDLDPTVKKSYTDALPVEAASLVATCPQDRVEGQSEQWQEVRRKRKRAKPSKPTRRLMRPDALLITASGGKSYAEILRQVKKESKLSELGQEVKSIRKTGKGDLLLQLSRPNHEDVEKYRTAVEEVLGEAAEVKSIKQEVALEIKDLDEITTMEDVYNALINFGDAFKSLQPSSVKSFRKAYGGTQTATIGVSTPLAKVLMNAGKIKIGWVVCRIRGKAPLKCYRCLEYGHSAMKCQSTHDFSNRCFRCGGNGHRMVACNSQKPRCLICSDDENNYMHRTGSTSCPKYKEALKRRLYRL